MSNTLHHDYTLTANAAKVDDDNEQIDLRAMAQLIWAKRAIVIGITMFFTIAAALILIQQTSLYTATAVLMLDTRKTNVVDLQSVVSGLSVDAAITRSEIEVLKSRRLAYRVVESLKLDKDPEFNPTLDGATPSLKMMIKSLFVTGEDEEFAIAYVVDNVLERLTIQNEVGSYALKLSFTSEDPIKAAKIANTWAEQYLTDQLEVKFDATERANLWLSKRLEELKEKVEQSDNAVVAMREKFNIIDSGGDTLAGRQLAEVNTQLILAQTARAQAEARLEQARDLIRARASYDSIAEVLASNLIQRLREQEATVVRQEAELASRYGDRHPSIINIRAEIRDLRIKIREEVDRIVTGLENEVQVARVREKSLQERLSDLEGRVTFLNRAQIQVAQLQREADANRTLYETFLARFKETFSQADIQQADARIIAYADIPMNPSYPRRTLITVIVFVASGLLGIFVVFLLEQLNNSFRTGQQVEKMTGLTTIGMVPKINTQGKAVETYIRENITSAYCEALRSVQTTLDFIARQHAAPIKSLLVTSSVPEEGKSMFALSLATVAAAGGARVLLIDVDMRRPTLAKLLGSEYPKGMTQYFSGQASINEIIQKDKELKLDYITTDNKTIIPQVAFGSPAMTGLLSYAHDAYDLVILDAPPLMAASDSVVLTNYVDHTLFCIRYESTSRKLVKNALKMLKVTTNLSISAVLTQVDVERHARYGYGDQGSYYGAYGDYYAAGGKPAVMQQTS